MPHTTLHVHTEVQVSSLPLSMRANCSYSRSTLQLSSFAQLSSNAVKIKVTQLVHEAITLFDQSSTQIWYLQPCCFRFGPNPP